MAPDPIYPKPNLSKCLQKAAVVPYLLRNTEITRPNVAWLIDITYIPMRHGFLYLTAIIDWYSRCIVGWEPDDTLDTRACIEACRKAFKVAKPLILNSDQGCQFTSSDYKQFLKGNGIRQSMDGKSRWADNIMIGRWFRSFKYEEAYLTEWRNIREARKLSRLTSTHTTLRDVTRRSATSHRHQLTILHCSSMQPGMPHNHRGCFKELSLP